MTLEVLGPDKWVKAAQPIRCGRCRTNLQVPEFYDRMQIQCPVCRSYFWLAVDRDRQDHHCHHVVQHPGIRP